MTLFKKPADDITQLLKEFDDFKKGLKKGGEMTEAKVVQAVAFAMAFRNVIRELKNV